ncbi:MAG: UDP-2,3-diacylglucosamine diphosphatase LpxI [Marinovum sp.]|nr:UDP-2,3-diacylglucosamine diphosphatase LpxI [Marinovum sp.]
MLALIAGAGDLPAAIAASLDKAPVIAALDGFWPEALTHNPELTWRVETLGTLLLRLKSFGVTEVCLCGAVERPSVDVSAIDAETRSLIPALQAALQTRGDDAVLRAVMGIFEEAHFVVRAAHDVAPGLLPPPGVLTIAQPPVGAEVDAAAGDKVSAAQGRADLGQACVIRAGHVVAREDGRGTDVMLRDLAMQTDDGDVFTTAMDGIGDMLGAASDWLSGTAHTAQGMFFKAPKPNQDHRADLPVIGPRTVASVADAGLAGLTIAHQGVMVLDLDNVIAACNARGLYLWVRDP